MSEYTADEKHILELLAEATTSFSRTTRQHPSETEEFYQAMNVAQNVIMARFAQRHEESGITPVKSVRPMGSSGIPPSEHPASIERG